MSLASPALGRVTDTLFGVFGEAATYTDRDAVALPCTVIVEPDLTRYGETAVVNQRTAVLLVRRNEVDAPPRRGETFTIGAKVWVVDSLQGSDELEHRVFAA